MPDNKEEVDQIYFDEAIYKSGTRYNKEHCKKALTKLIDEYKNDFSTMNCLLCGVSASKCAATMRGENPVEYVQHSDFDCRFNQQLMSVHEKLIYVGTVAFNYKPPFCHCQDIGIRRVPV